MANYNGAVPEETMETDVSPLENRNQDQDQVQDDPMGSQLDLQPKAIETAQLYLTVDLPPEQKVPTRWPKLLEKSLQTFCAKAIAGCDVMAMKLVQDNPQCAYVEVAPPSAVAELLEMKTIELQFTKDFRGQFKAHFSQQMPDAMLLPLSTALSAPQDVRNQDQDQVQDDPMASQPDLQPKVIETAQLYLTVDFPPEQKVPIRWPKLLEKSLQTFCAKAIAGCDIMAVKLVQDNPRYATVEIAPPSAVAELLEMKTIELLFTKDFRGQFKAHFSQQMPDAMPLPLRTALSGP
ncbi:uncharacterized protein LOC136752859 [Amia ocellicauda]|uniref:uncharacterized protein LOC136752859 n=1 Tax=Amia ocellicauda TaxID=2972642 RepID=UPI00346420BA